MCSRHAKDSKSTFLDRIESGTNPGRMIFSILMSPWWLSRGDSSTFFRSGSDAGGDPCRKRRVYACGTLFTHPLLDPHHRLGFRFRRVLPRPFRTLEHVVGHMEAGRLLGREFEREQLAGEAVDQIRLAARSRRCMVCLHGVAGVMPASCCGYRTRGRPRELPPFYPCRDAWPAGELRIWARWVCLASAG